MGVTLREEHFSFSFSSAGTGERAAVALLEVSDGDRDGDWEERESSFDNATSCVIRVNLVCADAFTFWQSESRDDSTDFKPC